MESESPSHSQTAQSMGKGKKRQIESPSSQPLAKRARVGGALGSPFAERRQRYDESAWLTISSPPSPLRPVGNITTSGAPVASSSKLPPLSVPTRLYGYDGSSSSGDLPSFAPTPSGLGATADSQPHADTSLSMFPSRRITSPSGGVYTLYEILPASSPTPTPRSSRHRSPPPGASRSPPQSISTPTRSPRRSRDPIPPTPAPAPAPTSASSRRRHSSHFKGPLTLEAIEAERARLAQRLRLHDRLQRASPARVVPDFAKTQTKLKHRLFVLDKKLGFMRASANIRQGQVQQRKYALC
ncbi:hypothetical protein B0H16DRAFT_1568583 [Mycena metata]|uniref:Uncharacterized protein n=1 Tax=Mycena metata TaxID=1033252 RepID=A0AAD7N118_9AGAR|nr:hypothetical protein B0H16DRAFT_1568583 [Mycena metata]